ncbi:GntR family transcriptional regulator [Mangrovactinospora gilvigrisea]|uniref:GntR family transcriptional regulator n=1 Tax=Mangrovactinospora gilvigrisea TaxID=1428644 RepID=UPI0009A13340|nr:GntR family transcriptional regulator [Mangrovactinospora gilvigrisea]
MPVPSKPLPYERIANELRVGIIDGRLAAGAQLTGENELMQRYSVARETARKALRVLRDEGLTLTRRGVGVFVRDARRVSRHASRNPAIAAVDETSAGMVGVEEVADNVTAPEHIARALGLREGELVCRRVQRQYAGVSTTRRSALYIPMGLAVEASITELDFGPGGAEARLREAGHAPARANEVIRVRMPFRPEAEDMRIEGAVPIVTILRTDYDRNGLAVQASETVLDGSRYALEYDFPLPEA